MSGDAYTDEREARLPRWAQTMLSTLRERVKVATEPLVAELAKLRPKVKRLRAQNEALTELLQCAALGGHHDAQTIVEVLQNYDIPMKTRDAAPVLEVTGVVCPGVLEVRETE